VSRACAFRFLCGCLSLNRSDEQLRALHQSAQGGDFAWETLIELASTTLVAPAFSSALRAKRLEAVVPGDVLDFFDGVATLNRQRNEKIRAEAINLALILNRLDVVPVLLKGGANLLSGLYADSAHRMMTDLDVLVPAQLLLDCVAELRRNGYEVLLDNGYPAHHHYPPLGRAGSVAAIELHAEALDSPYDKLLAPAEIFATTSTLECGASLAVPSPACRIVHAITHAQLSDHDYLYGRLPLRELVDLALLDRAFRPQIDWPAIRGRFARCRATTALDFHLLAAERLLGVTIDDEAAKDATARVFCRRAIWQVSHPGARRLSERLLRPWLLLRRTLSRKVLRKRFVRNLRETAWYRRQWRMLLHK
jgi:hypothetical protein